VVDTDTTSGELEQFTREAFDLIRVASDGHYVLYRTPLASPLASASSTPGIH
jgi:hypothetical protein